MRSSSSGSSSRRMSSTADQTLLRIFIEIDTNSNNRRQKAVPCPPSLIRRQEKRELCERRDRRKNLCPANPFSLLVLVAVGE
jgi:hypothetical protein